MSGERRRRANGEESRRRILAAAAAIAGERGYEGTTISQVSERSGLPASSIYWHFADKDALIATVIAESFEEWVAAMSAPRDGETPTVTDALTRAGRAMRASPDFVRLGLMLTLEHRPEEPAARGLFLETRQRALDNAAALYRRAFPDLDDDAIATLTRLAMAIMDGLFIAGEAGTDPAAIGDTLEVAGAAITAAAERLGTRSATR